MSDSFPFVFPDVRHPLPAEHSAALFAYCQFCGVISRSITGVQSHEWSAIPTFSCEVQTLLFVEATLYRRLQKYSDFFRVKDSFLIRVCRKARWLSPIQIIIIFRLFSIRVVTRNFTKIRTHPNATQQTPRKTPVNQHTRVAVRVQINDIFFWLSCPADAVCQTRPGKRSTTDFFPFNFSFDIRKSNTFFPHVSFQ